MPPPERAKLPQKVYYAVLTMHRNHFTRCSTILRTWGSVVPAGHLIFYSDQPDETRTLPVVALSNVTGYEDAQDRFTYLIMPHALERMEILSCNWLAWLDDDTWVWPENLVHLLAQHDPTTWVWLGQKCPVLRGSHAFCGGAGFAMSYPLVKTAACIAPACTDRARVEIPYDRRMGVCFERVLNLRITDVTEFNSQPPFYYMTAKGQKDRPKGFGHPATFHYVKTPPANEVSPEQHYTALWAITRAGAPQPKVEHRRRWRQITAEASLPPASPDVPEGVATQLAVVPATTSGSAGVALEGSSRRSDRAKTSHAVAVWNAVRGRGRSPRGGRGAVGRRAGVSSRRSSTAVLD